MKCNMGEIRPQWMANAAVSTTQTAVTERAIVRPVISCASDVGNSELP